MRPLRIPMYCTAAVLVLASLPGSLFAQDPPSQDQGPPERGVARMSVMNGEVSVRRGDSGEWVAAALNAPLMVDDRVSAGNGSRAEVQFDSANLIRIGANAEIRLAQLDYGHYHVQVAHGTVTYRVLRDSHAQVEVDTPLVSIRPAHVGVYRIYVQEDGQTEITVRLGSVEIATAKGSEQLQAGQTMLARGDPDDPEFRIVPAIARDAWDGWNEQRDREMQNSSSYHNVPEDVYGAEDLDNHGKWVSDPSYGEVWAPSVDADWAPYQNGRWVWEDYYGWTWVSSDPWGWAPFHYGRWFYAASLGWCWYPGGFGPHYWSPAMVAFFGFGAGGGVGFGFGNVGWVALAPYEPIYPWWGRSFYAGYQSAGSLNRNVNISNVSVASVYRNARVSNAVASVSAADFRQGRFTNITRTPASQVREAGLIRGQLPVAPTAASLRYSNRSLASVPRSSENTRFFTRNAFAPVQRVPLAEQQRSLQQYSRQPAIGQGGWRPVTAQQPSASRASWQRFGEPRASTVSATPPAQANSVRVAPPVVRERPATQTVQHVEAPKASSHTTSSGSSGGTHGGGSHR